MKILAIEKECRNTSTENLHSLLKEEAQVVWALYQQEIIREIYFRKDQSSAVLILECESLFQAENVLSTLPLVREKLIFFELIPLAPYPGFERLF